MARNPDDVSLHTFKVRVQMVQLRGNSATYRITLPRPVVTVLDLQKGDELVLTWDPATRRLTAAKGEPRRR